MRAMDAITTFTPTPAESALVDRIFAIADVQNTGTISPDAARRIFLGSNLPSEALEEIWEIANVEENPTYGKYCVGIAVRLVGHLQNGAELSEKLVSRGTRDMPQRNLVIGLMPCKSWTSRRDQRTSTRPRRCSRPVR